MYISGIYSLLYVQEVCPISSRKTLCIIGQDFLDIQYPDIQILNPYLKAFYNLKYDNLKKIYSCRINQFSHKKDDDLWGCQQSSMHQIKNPTADIRMLI